jgi:hypothetical protein
VDFSPPAGFDDFERTSALLSERWSEFLSDWLRAVIQAAPAGHSFFHPADGELGQARRLALSWNAFPGALASWYGEGPENEANANRASDTLARMVVGFRRTPSGFVPVTVLHGRSDDYCEWYVESKDGVPRRVTFTTEQPEYYDFLAREDPTLKLVADLYSAMLGTTVLPRELTWPHDVLVPAISEPTGWAVRFKAGEYNPYNAWNTTRGIVHCTHPDNTLVKAAMLVAGASVRRDDGSGHPITDPERLICASAFGDPNRTSDPAIGAYINAQARAAQEVSVADPIGIYISDLPTGGLTGAPGKDVSQVWTVERAHGTRDDDDVTRILRARFEVPAGCERVLLDGVPVKTGGQLARRLRLTSSVLIRPRGGQPPLEKPIARCVTRPGTTGMRGVFVSDVDWQTAPVVTGAEVEEQPLDRVDPPMLDGLAPDTVDARWSRLSRLSRLSLYARWS